MKRLIKEVAIVVAIAILMLILTFAFESTDLLGYTSVTIEILVKYAVYLMLFRYLILLMIYLFKKSDIDKTNSEPRVSLKVTDNNRSVIVSLIIAIGLIVSMTIYAFSTRYITDTKYQKRYDRWTGEVIEYKEKDNNN